jgi:glycosyltransferase involved in cell wall biosynthesis
MTLQSENRDPADRRYGGFSAGTTGSIAVNGPRTAYILLLFPKPSETFIFREVVRLLALGLPLKVYTLYGPVRRDLSPEMQAFAGPVERLGRGFVREAPVHLLYWLRRQRRLVLKLLRALLVKPFYGLEKTGENLWAFLAGLYLARRFAEEGIEHIHAPWASGPATAAWVASRLTGIPFSFNTRAWDIYPPDGALGEKIEDAVLVRSETAYNIIQLTARYRCDPSKFHLTYNGVPLEHHQEAPVPMKPPYRLLALGRFVAKKGFDDLLCACQLLVQAGLDFTLTLAGDGSRRRRLERLTRHLRLTSKVRFPGFVTYDLVPDLFQEADIFIMPSVVAASGDRDGIPLVLMEALMHRVPVVATAVSGIPELIEDGVTGLLVPQKNPTALAAAVTRLCRDRETSLSMAEAGRDRVMTTFSPEANYRAVFELYRRYFPTGPGRTTQAEHGCPKD